MQIVVGYAFAHSWQEIRWEVKVQELHIKDLAPQPLSSLKLILNFLLDVVAQLQEERGTYPTLRKSIVPVA